MCGRYANSRSAADLSALFTAVDDTAAGLEPNYNVAPTTAVPVVRLAEERDDQGAREVAAAARPGAGGSHPSRRLCLARWGLVPRWADDLRAGARMINARAETAATSRAFARPFAAQRCLIPADGWYEWARGPGGRRQAYFMTPRDGSVLCLAGLWELWPGPRRPAAGAGGAGSGQDHGRGLLSCTVLTTSAVGELAEVHDRMPLLLPAERWSHWLAGPATAGLLEPPPAAYLDGIEVRPVGPAVGNVRNGGPGLTARVPTRPEPGVSGPVPGPDTVDLTLF